MDERPAVDLGDVAREGDDLARPGDLGPDVAPGGLVEPADLGFAGAAEAAEVPASDLVALAKSGERLDDLLARVETDDVGRTEDEVLHAALPRRTSATKIPATSAIRPPKSSGVSPSNTDRPECPNK